MDRLFRWMGFKGMRKIMTSKALSAFALHSIPIIKSGDNLVRIVLESVKNEGINLENGDIFVIASKIVSRSEGRVVQASEVKVSNQALEIAQKNDFDPVHVELALRESALIIKNDGVLITETHTGLICNYSGVDKSNAPEAEYVLLPINPDQSAERIQIGLEKETGLNLAVIITDTQGRPWRKGSINIAIGCAGINAFKHNKGKIDLHGRVLKRSSVCQIDELASFAEPLMGQAGERVPVAIVRGYLYGVGAEKAIDINRSRKDDLFR